MSLAIPEEVQHQMEEGGVRQQADFDREQRHRQEVLGRVELLRNLTADEIRALAVNLTPSPFARGDVITRQGADADWLYILDGGEADVFLERQGERRLLSTLGRGSIFGEMGLLTGAPRQATVIARSYVESYRLDKAGFEAILHDRPEIADEMARILANRGAELDRARQGLDDAAQTRQHETNASILARMQKFFHL
jgi:CRP-like cAMP-binding protein